MGHPPGHPGAPGGPCPDRLWRRRRAGRAGSGRAHAAVHGLRLRSGDWVLDVAWQDGRYHAVIPDGRSALAFDILRDASGRQYLWLGDRVLTGD